MQLIKDLLNHSHDLVQGARENINGNTECKTPEIWYRVVTFTFFVNLFLKKTKQSSKKNKQRNKEYETCQYVPGNSKGAFFGWSVLKNEKSATFTSNLMLVITTLRKNLMNILCKTSHSKNSHSLKIQNSHFYPLINECLSLGTISEKSNLNLITLTC